VLVRDKEGSLIQLDLSGDIVSELVTGFLHEGFVVKIIEFGHGCQTGKMFMQ